VKGKKGEVKILKILLREKDSMTIFTKPMRESSLCRGRRDTTQYDLYLSVDADKRFIAEVGNIFRSWGRIAMNSGVHAIANVRRQPSDYRISEVALELIRGPHWDIVSGGVHAIAAQPLIYGYVFYTDIRGEIAHSRTHGPRPHNIKVCLTKKDNPRRAGQLDEHVQRS